jgi:hypothetical protein
MGIKFKIIKIIINSFFVTAHPGYAKEIPLPKYCRAGA